MPALPSVLRRRAVALQSQGQHAGARAFCVVLENHAVERSVQKLESSHTSAASHSRRPCARGKCWYARRAQPRVVDSFSAFE